MGYSAIVRCSCYREGRTTTPPHAEYVRQENFLYLDLDGLGLNQATREAWDLEFDLWQQHACPHPNMDYVVVHLQNNSGMGAFRATLAELDAPHRYPVLHTFLPVSNGGTLPVEYAAAALREIEALAQELTPADDSPRRVRVAERHEYILGGLRTVLTAALAVGNPVIWC